MDFKDHITPPDGSDKEPNPLNMVFKGYPSKNGGYMVHFYLDQSAVRIGTEADYDKVVRDPFLTPKYSGPSVADDAIYVSGKLMDTLMEKSNFVIDPDTGTLYGSCTTTMTKRDNQWQPDINNITKPGFYQTAHCTKVESLGARVDKSISVAKEAAKFDAKQRKQEKQAGAEGESKKVEPEVSKSDEGKSKPSKPKASKAKASKTRTSKPKAKGAKAPINGSAAEVVADAPLEDISEEDIPF